MSLLFITRKPKIWESKQEVSCSHGCIKFAPWYDGIRERERRKQNPPPSPPSAGARIATTGAEIRNFFSLPRDCAEIFFLEGGGREEGRTFSFFSLPRASRSYHRGAVVIVVVVVATLMEHHLTCYVRTREVWSALPFFVFF